ncbi:MAG: hypothetical protein WC551_01665 [Patescibacteria group bacterium]
MKETTPSSLETGVEVKKAIEDASGLLAASESFEYFRKNGIKPPSQSSWTKVLIELGSGKVAMKQGALQAYAEATNDKNLAKALKGFKPDAARLVAEMKEEEAEAKYAELLEERRGLKEGLPDLKEKLEYHRKEYEKDLDQDQYVDEFEGKLGASVTRIRSIEDQLEMMRAAFYIPDDLIDQEFTE